MTLPIRTITRVMCLAAAGLTMTCACSAQAQNAEIAGLIADLTWAQPQQGRKTIEALLARGPDAVQSLAGMLQPPGAGDDADVRFALHGMVMAVQDDEHGPERAMLANALSKALTTTTDPNVKAFLVRQLELAGNDEAVASLAALLSDEQLADPAAQALVQIGSPAAAAALRKALTAAPADGRRMTFVQALGELGDLQAVPLVRPFADADNMGLRQVALTALGSIGDPQAVDLLAALAASENPADRALALHALARAARKMHERGDAAGALAACQTLQALPGGTIRGLSTQVAIRGPAANARLVDAATTTDDDTTREAILRLAEAIPGEAVSAAWVSAATAAEETVQADIIAMLGRRGDSAALPAVRKALESNSPEVQQAARTALGRFGGRVALQALVPHVAAGDKVQAQAGADVLSWVSAQNFNQTVADALPGATVAGKQALLGLLAARQAREQADAVFALLDAEDKGVSREAFGAMQVVADRGDVPRMVTFMLQAESTTDAKAARNVIAAACKRHPEAVNDVLMRLDKATEEQKAALLQTLGMTGGDSALDLVVQHLNNTNDEVRDAAVRALASWPTAKATDPLLQLVETADSEVHRVLALRGYVRLASATAGSAPEQTAAMLAKAWDKATTAADRKLVLSGLAKVRHEKSLELVMQAMDQESLQAEAAAAALAICCPANKDDPGLRTPDAYKAMARIVELAPNDNAVKTAREHMTRFPLGGGVNIALGKTVTTSCPQQGDKAPWKAVDGKLDKLDAWFGDRWPSWIQVDLGKPTAINAVRLVFYYDGKRYYQYTVETSLDGETWTKVADNSANDHPADAKGLVHRFDPIQAQYVRLNILKNSVNEAVHLVEFEVYSDDEGALKPAMKQVNDPGNIALGKPVSTSIAHETDKVPARAVNGVLERNDGWWGAGTPAWLQVDLGSAQAVDTVRPIFYWDGKRYYQYTVQGSTDGKAWQTLADNSKNTTPSTSMGVIHTFKPVDVRYVRLNIIKNSSNPSCHLAELEVYAAGKAPKTFPSAEPPAPAPPKAVIAGPLPEPDQDGFIPLFNGKDLSGWMGDTAGYAVEDGALVCKEKGGGKLFTEHRFSDFVLSFDFTMPKGANNGLAIRSPAAGNPAYAGMELQIIDNQGYEDMHNYALKPWQTHGSIYGCVPAKTGALKPVGEWNHQQVTAVGPRITVVLNGQTIVDANLDELSETADGKGLKAHPGLQRQNGHIGWLGHGARVAFRNIRIKPLHPYTKGPHNVPPEGFKALFNGKDLSGWKGLLKRPYDNPEKRAQLAPEELKTLQAEADADMRAHWAVEDETFVFDGKGRSLCTDKDYADFEMLVDWKIKPNGDSGIYLRGSPQVQIWDPAKRNIGSGGLFNNKKHPSEPSECADNPIGEWNRFFIRMVGERVTIRLNGVLVVDNVVMENYWNRNKPIFPKEQIELQNHGNTLWFRNIYLRELTAK